MTIEFDNERSSMKKGGANRAFIVKVFVALVLIVTLAVNVIPILAVSKPSGEYSVPDFQTAATSSLTFKAEADARVEERHPTTNLGTSDYLAAVQANKRNVESYVRFTVNGITDVIQTAHLRLYSTTDTSDNGPAVYATNDNDWTETEITWNDRPQRLGLPGDNKDAIKRYSWVEYDVTALVKGNGTYSFVLAGDSNDAVRFSSRESSNGPQLIITVAPGTPTPTVTPQPTATFTATPTPSNDIILVGAGDIASCGYDTDERTAQLLDGIPGTVFTAGDDAYPDGTYEQFMNCYDPTWGRHKARTKPVPGNHDYNTAEGAAYYQYFNNIEPYYVYTLGSWRIYALNSEIDVSAASPQINWLKKDLMANPTQCILAYWHRPRWSSGAEHGSDPAMETLWQIFHDAGAELIINGHDHGYERFSEMDDAGTAVAQGLREFVVGTGGAGLYDFGPPLPASEVRDNTTFGVLKLTLHATSYDWEFVPIAGSTFTDSGSGDCR